MTVYPLVFSIFGLEITGFGLMMMAGFLAAGWVMGLELERRGLNKEYSADVVVAAVIGGILGAKIWYVALNGGSLFSRGGLVWWGGLIGGLVVVLGMGWWKRIPARFTLELTAPALAVGHALGRLGCFLVQDDYGLPTDLPWGMKFPEGQPPTTVANLSRWGAEFPPGTSPAEVIAVHPTQLYEVAALLFLFYLLWRWRRHQHAVGWLFAVYLIGEGIERFLVEFVRAKDDRVLGGYTLAQAAAVLALVAGVALLLLWKTKDRLEVKPEGALAPKGTA
jgi:phosphatidylglycerol:prolipoprotein diacylglycerol transferase